MVDTIIKQYQVLGYSLSSSSCRTNFCSTLLAHLLAGHFSLPCHRDLAFLIRSRGQCTEVCITCHLLFQQQAIQPRAVNYPTSTQARESLLEKLGSLLEKVDATLVMK